MQTLVAFIEFVLGFVPFFGSALVFTAIVWAATKLLPAFGVWMDGLGERMFGVDDEYDEKYNTGYARTPAREQIERYL